ncbi:MAG: mycofactocin biosynthesis peptidyl-dipeptidase MftE [Ilumatobacteraceae bacterium]
MSADRRSRLLVVPVGSFEQHGAHLPPSTDSLIITAVAGAACTGHGATLGPTVNVTASDEHAGFAGTLSIGTDLTAATLVSIATSATGWTDGVLFANGHGGNADALAMATEELSLRGVPHDVWSLPAYDGADMHAGLTETSVMLHLHPDLVRMDLARPGNTGGAADLMPAMRAGGVRAVSTSGVLGDPTGATAAHGRAVFTMWVGSLSNRIDGQTAGRQG